MSGASTPLQDEVPHGPLTVSVQDICDGIVLDASQLNLMLSLGEKVGDQVISEDEEQEDSDREDEGEFSEDKKREVARNWEVLLRRRKTIKTRVNRVGRVIWVVWG